MSTAYQGRHTGGVNRRTPAVGKARTAVQGLSHTLRRPLVSAAAILAVAGVSAAASSEALPYASGASCRRAAFLCFDAPTTGCRRCARPGACAGGGGVGSGAPGGGRGCRSRQG